MGKRLGIGIIAALGASLWLEAWVHAAPEANLASCVDALNKDVHKVNHEATPSNVKFADDNSGDKVFSLNWSSRNKKELDFVWVTPSGDEVYFRKTLDNSTLLDSTHQIVPLRYTDKKHVSHMIYAKVAVDSLGNFDTARVEQIAQKSSELGTNGFLGMGKETVQDHVENGSAMNVVEGKLSPGSSEHFMAKMIEDDLKFLKDSEDVDVRNWGDQTELIAAVEKDVKDCYTGQHSVANSRAKLALEHYLESHGSKVGFNGLIDCSARLASTLAENSIGDRSDMDGVSRKAKNGPYFVTSELAKDGTMTYFVYSTDPKDPREYKFKGNKLGLKWVNLDRSCNKAKIQNVLVQMEGQSIVDAQVTPNESNRDTAPPRCGDQMTDDEAEHVLRDRIDHQLDQFNSQLDVAYAMSANDPGKQAALKKRFHSTLSACSNDSISDHEIRAKIAKATGRMPCADRACQNAEAKKIDAEGKQLEKDLSIGTGGQ